MPDQVPVGGYPELPDAQAQTRAFLDTIPSGPVALLHDGDVDGLGAAAVMLDALGEREVTLPGVPKGANAFTPEMAERVRDAAALLVLDLGVRDVELLPGRPQLLLDHHRPAGQPPGATVVTGYGWSPVPTSSLLAWLVAGTPENAWRAAIGNAGDLGPTYGPFEEAAKAQKRKWFDAAKSLLNAPKRSSDPEAGIPAALRALRAAPSAQAVVEATGPDADLLRAQQMEVKTALAEAKRVGPKFSKSEPIALLRIHSPARIHPLLAQSWRGRLPKHVVMAVNGGYLPGRVNFSMRTSSGINLLDLLARYKTELGFDEPEYGLGHDGATGGSLTNENFARLLAAMGFEA